MGGQKRVGPSFCVTVSNVISVSNFINSSTITSLTSPRPLAEAASHAFSISASVLIVDCPLPEEDIRGLTTHGIPILATALFSSSSEEAYSYLAVLSPSSFEARSRMAFLFIVKFAARAEGTTCMPCFS